MARVNARQIEQVKSILASYKIEIYSKIFGNLIPKMIEKKLNKQGKYLLVQKIFICFLLDYEMACVFSSDLQLDLCHQ